MRLLFLLFGLLVPSIAEASPSVAQADASPGSLCTGAVEAAEKGQRTPNHLLRSIGIVESGRTDPQSGRVQSWPWTINAQGQGHFYDSKAEAIAAVEALQARGVRSIDVGCMQINLMHHPNAFSSLDEAFDPHANATYGGRFLTALYHELGTWERATAAYHSQTADIGTDYARKVMAVWGHPMALPPAGPSDASDARLFSAFAAASNQYRAFAPQTAMFAAFIDPATLPRDLRGFGGLSDKAPGGKQRRPVPLRR